MLIALVGDQGTGKSLVASVFGNLFKDILKVPLYANYELKNSKERIKNLQRLYEIEKGIVILDEFWLTADSRTFKNNVVISQFINQTRKKDLLVIYTTQYLNQIDLRIRQATDYLFHCEKNLENIVITAVNFKSGKILKKLVLNSPQQFYELYNTREVLTALE